MLIRFTNLYTQIFETNFAPFQFVSESSNVVVLYI